jgi:hypothetical protein
MALFAEPIAEKNHVVLAVVSLMSLMICATSMNLPKLTKEAFPAMDKSQAPIAVHFFFGLQAFMIAVFLSTILMCFGHDVGSFFRTMWTSMMMNLATTIALGSPVKAPGFKPLFLQLIVPGPLLIAVWWEVFKGQVAKDTLLEELIVVVVFCLFLTAARIRYRKGVGAMTKDWADSPAGGVEEELLEDGSASDE